MAVLLVTASPAWAQPAPTTGGAATPAASDRALAPFFPLDIYWSFGFELQPTAAPATDGARIFVPWANGNLSALDITTGKPITAVGASTTLPLIVDGESLLVTAADAIQALRVTDLQARWRTPLAAKPAFAPVVRAGWAFIAHADGTMTALRTDTGAVVWRTEPEAPATSAPVVEGDRLYTTGSGGQFVARTVSSGAEDWRVTLDGDVTAAAAVEGRVFAATTGRWLYALDAKRGQVRWRYRLGGSAIGMMTDEDRVVVVMLDQSVRAFKMGSGAQVWRRTLTFRPVAGPVAAGGSLLVTGYGPAVRILDRRTGANQGTYTIPLPPPITVATATLASGPLFRPGPTIFDDVVILSTQHGYFHAARRLAEPMALPVTAMPGPALPAPGPPPGWVEPAAAPKTESAEASPAAATPATSPAPTPAATPASAPAGPPPPAPKPPR